MNKEWEKKFDKEFRPIFKTGIFTKFNDLKYDDEVEVNGTVGRHKRFITSLLKADRQDIIKAVEKERDLPWEELMEITIDVESYRRGLNKVIKILNK